MRYKVNGKIIKSENSAKPTSTASKIVLEYIDALPGDHRVLDMGCGKLRHTIPLSKRVAHVTAVDSTEQVYRKQVIAGKKAISIYEYANRYLPNVTVATIDNARWKRSRFDFVLIAHVLSAIPDIQARINVLRDGANVLKRRTGHMLIVTNYSNTRFRAWEKASRATAHLDGWIIENKRGTSFFGMIPVHETVKYCVEIGLRITQSRTVDGRIAIVEAAHQIKTRKQV